MKRQLNFLIGGIAATLFSLAATAQPGPGMQGSGGMGGMSGMTDTQPGTDACAKSRDPQRCAALQKAKDSCKDKAGADKRKCMMDAMPPMDCSKTRNPARCEASQKAKEACKDKPAAEHRQCMRDNMPKGGKQAAPKN